MSTETTTGTLDPSTRRTPPLGGFSLTFLRLEVRRLLRNRRAVIFTLVMPSLLFLLFGTDGTNRTRDAGNGNVTAYIAISMGVYGAMIASTSGGAMVATERAVGWSRQLRLTPLHPVAYILVKAVVAMLMAAAAIVAVFVVSSFFGVEIAFWRLALAGIVGWLCSMVFAALGLFAGYLLPSENVMQVLGPGLALLSFAGGLFVPAEQFGHTFETIAQFTPAYGVGVLARYPLVADGNVPVAILNLVVWGAIFVAGAAWRMSKDTARV